MKKNHFVDTNKKIICYHGTNKKNADLILKQGFRDGTFFARHLEDALGYGGKWIFEVWFCEENLPKGWQFTSNETPPDRIIAVYKLEKRKMLERGKLRDKVFDSNNS